MFLPVLFGVLFVLYKRPACKTMWDMMIPVMAVTSGFSMLSKNTKLQIGTVGVCLSLITVLFARNSPLKDLSSWAQSLKASKENEQIKWTDFEARFQEAKGLPIVVFIENNNFCFGGIDEFMLKAACICPTWEINESGKRWIHTYFPNYFLMHGNGSKPAWPKGLDRIFFFWYERPDLPKLSQRQPDLYQEIQNTGSLIEKKQYFLGGNLHMEIYSAMVNL
jgi:hypothetical protein